MQMTCSAAALLQADRMVIAETGAIIIQRAVPTIFAIVLNSTTPRLRGHPAGAGVVRGAQAQG